MHCVARSVEAFCSAHVQLTVRDDGGVYNQWD